MPSNFAFLLGRSHHQALGQVNGKQIPRAFVGIVKQLILRKKIVFIENNLIIAKLVLWYLNSNAHNWM